MDGPGEPGSAATSETPTTTASWRRRLLVWILPLIVVGLAVWFYGSAGRFVATDNAYLQQDRIDVAPQVGGDVMQVFVAENARVAAGDPVLQLDATLAKIAVTAAEARLGTAQAEVESMKASYREKVGQSAVARRAAELSLRELERQKQLAERRLIPASQLDAVQRSTDIAVGSLVRRRTDGSPKMCQQLNSVTPLEPYWSIMLHEPL